MTRPAEYPDEWFNLFMFHQNRSKHGATNYIPETFLHDFIDLVVWGHEHECRLDPEPVDGKHYVISQPGSSVLTALCEGEAVKKFALPVTFLYHYFTRVCCRHAGLLRIKGREFQIEKLPLKSVRPFKIADVSLADEKFAPEDTEAITRFLISRVRVSYHSDK